MNSDCIYSQQSLNSLLRVLPDLFFGVLIPKVCLFAERGAEVFTVDFDKKECSVEGKRAYTNKPEWTTCGFFHKEIVEEVHLKGQNLQGLFFSRGTLINASLDQVDLRGADFWGAAITKASVANSDLSKTEFGWTDVTSSSFTKVNFSGSLLKGSRFKDVSFKDVNLQNVQMQGTNLQDVKFKGVNLKGAVLDGATLQNVRFENVEYDMTTSWPVGFDKSVLTESSPYEWMWWPLGLALVLAAAVLIFKKYRSS